MGRQDHPIRIFNAYNAASGLIEFGDGNARLVVDGRADMWGDAYIHRVVAVQNLGPGWQSTLADFRPEAIVVPRTAPLARVLPQLGSWHPVTVDKAYVLLLPGKS